MVVHPDIAANWLPCNPGRDHKAYPEVIICNYQMSRRADFVLASIPVFAVGGVAAERFAPLVAPSSGVERLVALLPLPAMGFLAALLVVGYAMFVLPPFRSAADS